MKKKHQTGGKQGTNLKCENLEMETLITIFGTFDHSLFLYKNELKANASTSRKQLIGTLKNLK